MENIEYIEWNTRTSTDILVEKIQKLALAYPEVYKITNPLDLFNYEEFDCNDLAPSFFQLQKALAEVKANSNSAHSALRAIDPNDIMLGPVSDYPDGDEEEDEE